MQALDWDRSYFMCKILDIGIDMLLCPTQFPISHTFHSGKIPFWSGLFNNNTCWLGFESFLMYLCRFHSNECIFNMEGWIITRLFCFLEHTIHLGEDYAWNKEETCKYCSQNSKHLVRLSSIAAIVAKYLYRIPFASSSSISTKKEQYQSTGGIKCLTSKPQKLGIYTTTSLKSVMRPTTFFINRS